MATAPGRPPVAAPRPHQLRAVRRARRHRGSRLRASGRDGGRLTDADRRRAPSTADPIRQLESLARRRRPTPGSRCPTPSPWRPPTETGCHRSASSCSTASTPRAALLHEPHESQGARPRRQPVGRGGVLVGGARPAGARHRTDPPALGRGFARLLANPAARRTAVGGRIGTEPGDRLARRARGARPRHRRASPGRRSTAAHVGRLPHRSSDD